MVFVIFLDLLFNYEMIRRTLDLIQHRYTIALSKNRTTVALLGTFLYLHTYASWWHFYTCLMVSLSNALAQLPLSFAHYSVSSQSDPDKNLDMKSLGLSLWASLKCLDIMWVGCAQISTTSFRSCWPWKQIVGTWTAHYLLQIGKRLSFSIFFYILLF